MRLRNFTTPIDEASLAQMRDFFTKADGPAKKAVPFKTNTPAIPPDVAMILHKVNKGVSIRQDEYNKLLKYKLELDMNKESVEEGVFGLSPKEKGAIQNITSKISDIPNMWNHRAQTFTNVGKAELEKALNYNPKYIKYALNLTAQDYEAESVVSEQVLDEVNMSPTNLRKLAASIDARAGMEFEMIVPNVQDPDGGEMEPDYDSDERVSSVSQIIDFFEGGDSPNSSRELERLRDQIYEAFYEWSSNAIEEMWSRDGESYCRDWIENNEWDEEEKIREHLESMGLDEADIEAAMDAGSRAPRFTKSSEQQAAREADENYNNYLEAADAADQELDELAATMAEDYGSQAHDEFEEENRDSLDESDFLRDEGYRWMSDIESNFDIMWPYYRSSGDGEADIETVASDFESAIGRNVNYSSSYHGGRRDGSSYVVEPDGSLDPDDSDDSGLEFVSPPLPVVEMLDDLKKTAQWAGRMGCYTNKSTGLHMNVSVANFSNDKLDYVKLALLLGDEYILNQFGRAGNTYCKSAMAIVRERVRERPEDAQAMLQKMKGQLSDIASKVIHSGSTHKYTSINTKDGYVEFRSPGGDWLGEYAADPGKIENTLLRFVVALDAACDPEKYRQDYLKKLYAILQPKTHNDTLAYFAQFAAGTMPKAALKSFIKQAQLERNLKKGAVSGQKYWWRVSNPPHSGGEIEVVATSKEEAIERALQPDGYPSWVNTRSTIEVKPLRPYDSSPVKATAGEPQPAGSVGQQTNTSGGEFTGTWLIKDANGRVLHRISGIGNVQADANRHAMTWLRQNPENLRDGLEVVPEMR